MISNFSQLHQQVIQKAMQRNRSSILIHQKKQTARGIQLNKQTLLHINNNKIPYLIDDVSALASLLLPQAFALYVDLRIEMALHRRQGAQFADMVLGREVLRNLRVRNKIITKQLY
jgi:hypothetical protein